MRYSSTHKQETRSKLLQTSRKIAKQAGFDATGIDTLMAAIGLTGGAFYSHFASKADLFAELIAVESEASGEMLAADDATSSEQVARQLRRYLGTAHVEHPEEGCALSSLGAEMARAAPEARIPVERMLRRVQRGWTRRLGGDADRAWALLAQCVGAVLLARVVESERTRREILAANRRIAEAALVPERSDATY